MSEKEVSTCMKCGNPIRYWWGWSHVEAQDHEARHWPTRGEYDALKAENAQLHLLADSYAGAMNDNAALNSLVDEMKVSGGRTLRELARMRTSVAELEDEARSKLSAR